MGGSRRCGPVPLSSVLGVGLLVFLGYLAAVYRVEFVSTASRTSTGVVQGDAAATVTHPTLPLAPLSGHRNKDLHQVYRQLTELSIPEQQSTVHKRRPDSSPAASTRSPRPVASQQANAQFSIKTYQHSNGKLHKHIQPQSEQDSSSPPDSLRQKEAEKREAEGEGKGREGEGEGKQQQSDGKQSGVVKKPLPSECKAPTRCDSHVNAFSLSVHWSHSHPHVAFPFFQLEGQ